MAFCGVGFAAGLAAQAQAQATAATPVRWWGLVNVSIDIAIYGGVPSGYQVWCEVAIGTSDTGGSNSTFTSDGFSQAAAASGATSATCNTSVAYEWLISPTTAPTDKLAVSYDVYLVNPNGLTIVGSKLYAQHSSNNLASYITLPANGATSSFTYYARL
jgi:hypothetical protein